MAAPGINKWETVGKSNKKQQTKGFSKAQKQAFIENAPRLTHSGMAISMKKLVGFSMCTLIQLPLAIFHFASGLGHVT